MKYWSKGSRYPGSRYNISAFKPLPFRTLRGEDHILSLQRSRCWYGLIALWCIYMYVFGEVTCVSANQVLSQWGVSASGACALHSWLHGMRAHHHKTCNTPWLSSPFTSTTFTTQNFLKILPTSRLLSGTAACCGARAFWSRRHFSTPWAWGYVYKPHMCILITF